MMIKSIQLIALLVLFTPIAFALPFSNGMDYRQNITINNTQFGSALTNYQVPLNITSSYASSNFTDLRFYFYNRSDSTEQPIAYWIEAMTENSHAYVWIKVPYIQANGYETVFLYYNDSAMASVSNVTNTSFEYNPCDTTGDVARMTNLCGTGSGGGWTLNTTSKYDGAGSCGLYRKVTGSGSGYMTEGYFLMSSPQDGLILKARYIFNQKSNYQNYIPLLNANYSSYGSSCIWWTSGSYSNAYGYQSNFLATDYDGTTTIATTYTDWSMITEKIYMPNNKYNFTYHNSSVNSSFNVNPYSPNPYYLNQQNKFNTSIYAIGFTATGDGGAGYPQTQMLVDDIIIFKYVEPEPLAILNDVLTPTTTTTTTTTTTPTTSTTVTPTTTTPEPTTTTAIATTTTTTIQGVSQGYVVSLDKGDFNSGYCIGNWTLARNMTDYINGQSVQTVQTKQCEYGCSMDRCNPSTLWQWIIFVIILIGILFAFWIIKYFLVRL